MSPRTCGNLDRLANSRAALLPRQRQLTRFFAQHVLLCPFPLAHAQLLAIQEHCSKVDSLRHVMGSPHAISEQHPVAPALGDIHFVTYKGSKAH
jgi:hypothetical protein